jgi:hypothetical protein
MRKYFAKGWPTVRNYFFLWALIRRGEARQQKASMRTSCVGEAKIAVILAGPEHAIAHVKNARRSDWIGMQLIGGTCRVHLYALPTSARGSAASNCGCISTPSPGVRRTGSCMSYHSAIVILLTLPVTTVRLCLLMKFKLLMLQEKAIRVTSSDQDRYTARVAPVWPLVFRRDPGCNHTLFLFWGI